VITGGRGDLAQAIASRLTEVGYQVHAPGRDELDVTCAKSVDNYFQQPATKEIDLLVNNAGLRRDGLIARATEADWDAVMDTNLKGSFLCARAALKGMYRRRNGHVLQIGSYSAISGPVGQSAYAAAKAGLIGLTKSIALEGGRRNVRANCVMPGFLRTKFIDGMSGSAVTAALNRHALGEFNTAADAAGFIIELDRMEHVSGQVFQLDSRV
jgi:3-oxoacyl-[acyl-carrier protein] reductase